MAASAFIGELSGRTDGPALRIVHADAQLVVADKPAGLLCVPGRGADKQDCLWARVQAHFPDALVVHRLDMATSGLCVFARGSDMQRRLGDAFAGREVHKQYQAIVGGEVALPEGAIELPLMADWPNRPRQKVDLDRGKPSLTRWRRLGSGPWPGTTRLALEPVTGRSHQLRVHLAAIGHPILGDTLYAPRDAAAASARLLLHAAELALVNAVDGRLHRWTSATPF